MKHYIIILLGLCFFCGQSPTKASRPNILFIIVDDLRPELGVYGQPDIQSPNMDKLAAKSLLFNRAYCNVPVCGASRASLLSGLRPLWPARFVNFATRADDDCPGVVTLPELFHNNGYTTISNGKVFHHKNDREKAWSETSWRPLLTAKIVSSNSQWVDPLSRRYVNEKSGSGPYFESADVPDTAYFDGQVAAKSVEDLRRLAKSDNPFFLAVGFIRPHLPFNAPTKYFDLYNQVKITDNRFAPSGLPAAVGVSNEILTYSKIGQYNSDEFHHEAKKGYYACVSYVDAQIGKVLDALQETGKADETIIVLIGDHGWHLGEHNFWGKHNVLENALSVPMIIKIPGMLPKPINQIVELVDLYPTLCKLAKLPAPEHLQGKDMLPMIAGKDPAWKDVAFTEWKGAHNITTSRYSYTEWVGEKNKGVNMLFDHKTDPKENRNVAGQSENKEVVKILEEKLRKLYKDINDGKK